MSSSSQSDTAVAVADDEDDEDDGEFEQLVLLLLLLALATGSAEDDDEVVVDEVAGTRDGTPSPGRVGARRRDVDNKSPDELADRSCDEVTCELVALLTLVGFEED